MPQLRHVAITMHNVEKTAEFSIDVFGMKEMGTINDSSTVERGAGFKGIHHIGFEVEDMATIQEKLAAAGSTRRHDVEHALGVMPGQRKHNVEVK